MSDTHAATNTASNDSAANWMRQIRQQSRKCDEENGVLRNLYKRAKADGQNTASMRRAIAATKLDPEVVQADMRDELRYMAILRIPMTPEGLFDWDAEVTMKTAEADDMWIASDKGYAAGRHGVDVKDSPYEEGDELYVHWLASWKQGQAAIARELGNDVKVADATRTRPVRAEPAPELMPEVMHPVVKKPRGRPRGMATRTRRRANGGVAAPH